MDVVEVEGDDAVGDGLVDCRQFDLDGGGVSEFAVIDGGFEDRDESAIDLVDGPGGECVFTSAERLNEALDVGPSK